MGCSTRRSPGSTSLFVDVIACYKKIRDAVPNLTQHAWYLDDGFLAGSEDQIRTTLDILANVCPKRGLYLRKDKCELWSIVDLPSVDQEVTGNTSNGFGSTGCRSRITRICLFLLAETCSEGCVALGKFELSGRSSMCFRHTSFLDRDNKLVYSLRTNTPTRDLIEVFDSSLRDALDQIIGTVTCDNAWKQSTLPINISYLGVRQSQQQYRAAFVGSVLASGDLVQKITNQRASDSRVFKELYTALNPST